TPGVRRACRTFWLLGPIRARTILVIAVRKHGVTASTGGLDRRAVKRAGHFHALCDLKEASRLFGLLTEIAIDLSGLRKSVLEEEALPALNLSGNILAATRQEKWHGKSPLKNRNINLR